MIVIDTNVLSEQMKQEPSAAVVAWFKKQAAASLYTTAVCEAEICLGLAVLPEGKRKRELMAAGEKVLELFAGRILPFDSEAANAFAVIVSARRVLGRPINDFDAQIAAISRSKDMTLATRNVSDFEGAGVKILDPWSAQLE